eukprot:COSAG02_NODE_9378_length_2237_cov_1.388213_1_plen_69_part_00
MDTAKASLRLIDPNGLEVTEGGHSIHSKGLRVALWTDEVAFCASSTIVVFGLVIVEQRRQERSEIDEF